MLAQVRLDMPNFSGAGVGPDGVSLGPGRHGLNALHLRTGRLPVAGRADEAVVSAPFAQAHGL